MATPYDKYRATKEWAIIDSAIKNLEANKDIQITTQPDYVVGFITKHLDSEKNPLFKILEELDRVKIHYKLERYREDTIMICVTVVGKRIEIEIFEDGRIESSEFAGDESVISGIEFVQKLIEDNRD